MPDGTKFAFRKTSSKRSSSLDSSEKLANIERMTMSLAFIVRFPCVVIAGKKSSIKNVEKVTPRTPSASRRRSSLEDLVRMQSDGTTERTVFSSTSLSFSSPATSRSMRVKFRTYLCCPVPACSMASIDVAPATVWYKGSSLSTLISFFVNVLGSSRSIHNLNIDKVTSSKRSNMSRNLVGSFFALSDNADSTPLREGRSKNNGDKILMVPLATIDRSTVWTPSTFNTERIVGSFVDSASFPPPRSSSVATASLWSTASSSF